MLPVPPSEDPLDIAARALARQDRGVASCEEHAQFLRWVQASPQHAAAIAALEQAWRRLDALRSLCPRDGDTPDPDLLAPDAEHKDADGA